MSAVPQTPPAPVDRRRFLGGSDVAAIMGLSPWYTPFQLFMKKVAAHPEPEDPERKKFFARRKRQEPVVAEMLADEYGIEVTRLSLDDNPNRYFDEEYPFLAAEIDFEFRMSPAVRVHFPGRADFAAIPDGTLLNGEIKTVHPFKASEWGEEGTEDVPIHYAAQVMHGLGVTRSRPAGLVAALFGLDKLVCFPVMRDDETVTHMRAKAVSFWRDYVLTGVPPEPINTEDVKQMYIGFSGKPAELSQEAYEALLNLEKLRKQALQLKQDQEELEWHIARSISFDWGVMLPPQEKKTKPSLPVSDNALLTFEGRQVGSWNRQRGTYLDQKRIAVEKPEIIQGYTVEHHYRVFRLKGNK